MWPAVSLYLVGMDGTYGYQYATSQASNNGDAAGLVLVVWLAHSHGRILLENRHDQRLEGTPSLRLMNAG
jgi:hypothetical protein